MRATSLIASKLRASRRRNPNSRPPGRLTLDRSAPELRGCQHLWTGMDPKDGYVTELRDQISDLHIPQINDVDNDVTWDYNEGAVVMEDNQNGSWLATAAVPYPVASGTDTYETTISAWFKTTRDFKNDATMYIGVLGWGERNDYDNCSLHIVENSGGNIDFVFQIRKANYQNRMLLSLSVANANSYANRWVHMAGVTAGNDPVKLFLDGQLMAGSSTTETSFIDDTRTNKVFVGKAHDLVTETYYAPFPGKLRDLRMYDRCVGEAEIHQMVKNPFGAFRAAGEQSSFGPLWLHPEWDLTAGTYNMTGNAAGLLMQRLLNVTTGSYAMTGRDAVLSMTRSLQATAGTYVMTGHDVTLVRTLYLQATSGVYNTTGSPITFEITRQAVTGLYVLTVAASNNTVSVQDVANTLA